MIDDLIQNQQIKTAYRNMRKNAGYKGVKVSMTLQEFWNIWKDDWELREEFQLCMVRKDFELPIQVGNVEIVSRKLAAARGSQKQEASKSVKLLDILTKRGKLG